MNYKECYELVKDIDDHYGMLEPQYQIIYDLASSISNGVFLELGVCHGRTAAILCYIANRTDSEYIGIDNFSLECSAAEVRQRLSERNLEGTILERNTHEATCGKEVDFLLIDAGHDEANVSKDIALHLPTLKSGGIVIFDDWDWDWYEDSDEAYREAHAHWAVSHYGTLYTKGWKVLDCYQGLLAKRKP